MSNIKNLVGIGQEFLVDGNGEIVAEFIDGNFSTKVLTGDRELTLSIFNDDICDCDDCEGCEHPCKGECGECQGCYDRKAEMAEKAFESGCIQGRF